ncbi:hypothetical protein EDB84DRAFT_1515826, partial [Lactarius hengduanensis]
MTLCLLGKSPSFGRVKYASFVLICRLSGVAGYQADEKFHRSHPNVAEKHYPELFKQFFPMASCQQTERRTKNSSQKGREVRSERDPFGTEGIAIAALYSAYILRKS